MDIRLLEQICQLLRRDLLINDGLNPDATPEEDDGSAAPLTVHAATAQLTLADGSLLEETFLVMVAGWPVDAHGNPPEEFTALVASLLLRHGLDLSAAPVRVEYL